MEGRAIVCAGQGAQFVGMGKDLAEAHPECQALFDKADDVLGYSLSTLCFDGPVEELTKSNHCQPAIFVVTTACYTALKKVAGDRLFGAAAGLSLGEWSALHLGGAIGFEDALRVLEARGRFMQEACESTQGGMVSVIGLDRNALTEICAQAGVEMANLNSEQQTVLSGKQACIEQAVTLAKEAGAKRTVVLNVAGAFHSSLMTPAAERLSEVLADIEIRTPDIPVVANVTGTAHTDPAAIRAAMVAQVNSSVNWLGCVQWLAAQGVRSMVECGPGKVLSGLIKRIDREIHLSNIQDIASLEAATTALQG